MLTFFVTQVSANVLSDIEHWTESEYNKARKELITLERETEDAAKYVAAKVAKESVSIAKTMEQEINKAINELERLTLSSLEGSCKEGTGKLTGPLKSVYSSIDTIVAKHTPELNVTGLNEIKQLSFLSSNSAFPGVLACKTNISRGMACGIFPYVQKIVTAVITGKANSEIFAEATGRAYKSNICSSMPVTDRGMCAVMLAAFDEGKKGASCVANVVEKVVIGAKDSDHNLKFRPSFPRVDQEAICYDIGGEVFAYAADAGLGGMIPDEVTRAKKIFKIAKALRTGLYYSSKPIVKETVTKICESGIKEDIKEGRIPTEKIVRIKHNENPGANLKLLTRLSDPVCLDLYVGKNKVSGQRCHGGPNQRWSFHDVGKSNPGYFWIRNGVNGDKCLAATSKNGGYVTAKCKSNLAQQNFEITSEGLLKNSKTKQCVNMLGHMKETIDYPCEDYSNNQKLYYDNPSLSLVKGSPGAHRQLYVHPSSPICLDFTVKGNHLLEVYPCNNTPYQSWSFHKYNSYKGNKNKKYSDYYQIQSDETGGCMTSNTRGAIASVSKCRSMNKEPHNQMYRISNGRFVNLHTGQCLQAEGFHTRNKIRNLNCSDIEKQKWHIFAK